MGPAERWRVLAKNVRLRREVALKIDWGPNFGTQKSIPLFVFGKVNYIKMQNLFSKGGWFIFLK